VLEGEGGRERKRERERERESKMKNEKKRHIGINVQIWKGGPRIEAAFGFMSHKNWCNFFPICF
jgi:hypothetical protein